ncbi:rhodanese-like domain-containing protein [Haloarculaceae archaeon H-GB2-1]|nr:hypothetical protein [Haloarculaceae archaeon H-GB1-1]MEA5386819.1 rhodanese-like domain-containing protein [Haloarculaceae archaeon H-GB11]MEA5408294.1 rhodanese-like domain-containing protein [Haloarculaceae archaeon H-GB2-1]
MVKDITAEQLADKIDADEQFTLIDTRHEDSFEAWHVHDAENVPSDPDEGLSEDQLNEVNALVGDASRGAELQSDSLHETIYDLPDDTMILPGHLIVTSDGRDEDGTPGQPFTGRLGDSGKELELGPNNCAA